MKKRFFLHGSVLVSILLMLLAAGCSNPEEKKSAHYQKGIEYQEKGNTDAAILEFKNAVQVDPKFADARYQLALAYLESGDIKSAFKEFKSVSDLDPDNIDAHVKTAELYFLAKQWDESHKHVDRILALEPTNVDGLLLKANLAIQEGNADLAEVTAGRHVLERLARLGQREDPVDHGPHGVSRDRTIHLLQRLPVTDEDSL